MKPKEKAEELVKKFPYRLFYYRFVAKECALIAVDEILNAHLFDLDEKEYWQQVRTEIENL